MKGVAWFVAILLFGWSLLRFQVSQSVLLWKLNLFGVESGHFLALLCLFPLTVLYRDYRAVALIAATASVFLSPTVQMLLARPETAPLDLVKLWLPYTPAIEPETRVFSQLSDGKELVLDLYRGPSSRSPWILSIHGGGWNSGDRAQFRASDIELARLGYAVLSISYRLAPQHIWPAAREDAQSAIDYARAHASELGLDPDRWVILGRSAGGQIAESIAYASPRPAGLRGCISFYAPADLGFAYLHADEDDILKSPQLLRDYLGGSPTEAASRFDDASPIRFVNADSPPTLLFHGPRDPLVWVRQSQRLDERLKAAGASSTYVEIPWATHGFDFFPNGPSGQRSRAEISRFLGKVL